MAGFVALAVMAWVDPARDWVFHARVFGASALILMAGSRWGYAHKDQASAGTMMAALPMLLPALAGWGALVTPPLESCAILLGGYLLQALWDVIAAQSGRITEWVARLRVEMAGLAALACLILMARLLFGPG